MHGPIPDAPGRVVVSGARGETVAFQLVLAADRDYRDVRVTWSDLHAEDGGSVQPPSIITAFRERAIEVDPVRRRIPGRLGAGEYYDPLPPLPPSFALTGKEHEVLWFDLLVPQVPAGAYTASIEILADGERYSVPVRLQVHDLAIEEASLPFCVGLQVGTLERVVGPWQKTLTPYLEMARDHRITTLVRGFGLADPGFEDHDRVLGPWIPGAKVWLLPIPPYFRVPYSASKDSLAVTERFQSVEQHWREKGWDLSRAIAWVYDEPSNAASGVDYPAELLAYRRAVPDAIPILITERPDSTIISACDVIASRADKWRDIGKRSWVYQDQGFGLPSEAIDTPPVNLRLWPWCARRYPGVDGVFLWAMNNWSDQPLVIPDALPKHYNDGQGVIVYPDPVTGAPISSIRMKAIRRGMQDAALLEMAERRAGDSLVTEMVTQVVPRALGEGRGWTVDPALLDAHAERLREMLSR